MEKNFVPNTKWMAEKYDEMNAKLFNGKLGQCDFSIFTTGRGSEGGTLGWFRVTAKGILVNRYSRRMHKLFFYDDVYVDRNNFYQICHPKIELNGNYSGTEQGFLATLVHEMCHYYTYMNGYCPRQGHGPEFREIGMLVSNRSNGLFTIQRLATAEDMNNLELNDAMKEKRTRRTENKKSRVSAIIVFANNGEVRLTITSNHKLINIISTGEKDRGNDVVVTNDASVIGYLFDKHYNKEMRTWRYWPIGDKPWIGELKAMLGKENNGELNKPQSQPEPQNIGPRNIFSIKTSNGVFEYDASNPNKLFNAIKERFPKMSIETIKKIMDNPNNYKLMENKRTTMNIIREVLEEFMANETSDDVEITPNMNLGKQSPLEI